jgi:hypothetical protein
MSNLTVTLTAVSVPQNASASLTLYEDVGDDGSGSNTDPNGKSYDNSDTVSLSDGTTSYTLSGFAGETGNAYWLEFQASNTDDVSTAEITAPITVDTGGSGDSAGSVLVFENGALKSSDGVLTTQ